jgi:hypothetical protein
MQEYKLMHEKKVNAFTTIVEQVKQTTSTAVTYKDLATGAARIVPGTRY